MSKLRLPGGDDHPAAAQKHLLDAAALIHQERPDGAAYLSGYVVECALKSLWLSEIAPPLATPPWKGAQGHNLTFLEATVSTLATAAGARVARYFKAASVGVPSSAINGWDPEMRYRPEAMTLADANTWWKIADEVFMETIGRMLLDGVI